ncbi:unnamed protein product [Calypogeia fissa]
MAMPSALIRGRIRSRLVNSMHDLLGSQFLWLQIEHSKNCSNAPSAMVDAECSVMSTSTSNNGNGNSATSRSRPPVAAKRIVEKSKHGRKWVDPYHWMRIDQEAAVQYLQKENKYSEEFMADTLPLQRKLETEMASRLKQQVSTPPERIGPWLYYTQVPEGKEYPVYCRKKDLARGDAEKLSWGKWTAAVLGWEDDKEEVLLDQNSLVEQFGYAQLGTCRLSEDHNLLAYTLDIAGNEIFTLFIKDLKSGQIMTEQTTEGVVNVEWARKSSTIFYTVADELLRPSRILCRSLDSNDGDKLIFEENDPSCFLDVSRTKDWSFITVNVNSKTLSEVYLINAEDPAGDLQLVKGRKSGVQYFVEHHEGFLYVLTNDVLNATCPPEVSGNYQLVRCPYKQLSSHNWQQVVGLQQGVFIEDMELFEKYLVLYQRQGGLPRIQVIQLPLTSSLDDLSIRTLLLPQEVCTIVPGANEDFHLAVLRISVSSANLPETVLEYNLASGNSKVLQQDEVVGLSQLSHRRRGKTFSDQSQGWVTSLSSKPALKSIVNKESRNELVDLSADYICQQHHVVGVDGTSVPVTVVHSCKLRKDGQNPALLIGYGAYGKSLEVEWCSERLSLLDRGWVIAFSHVRGGGELGKSWHRSGQLLQKKNSFSDFVASANFLVDEKYAHKCKLCALGNSAGGLLVASAVNLCPSLFRAIVLQVPFLDVKNTLLDKTLPLSVHEYDEWGDPDDPEAFANISSFSPYDNVQAGAPYPATLVKSGFLDTRVGYWEASKWVAKVRDSTKKVPPTVILLKTSMDTGHFGDGGHFRRLRETAYDYAFLIKIMDS